MVKGVVSGCIDGIFNGALRGWVEQLGSEPIAVKLLVNGIEHDVTLASRPMPQLQTSGGKCFGFSFDLGNLPEKRTFKLSARTRCSNFDFHDEALSYCRLVEKHENSLANLFHVDFYRAKYSLKFDSDIQALDHYLRFGIYAEMDPNPWFSSAYFRERYPQLLEAENIPILSYIQNEQDKKIRPSDLFDPAFYTNKHKDLKNLEKPFEHYVLHGHREWRLPVRRELPNCIFDEIEDIVEIEYGLSGFLSSKPFIQSYPNICADTYLPTLLKMTYPEKIEAVICVPSLAIGGEGLYASQILKAYQDKFGKEHVLLVVTDDGSMASKGWTAEGDKIHQLLKKDELLSLEGKVRRLHSLLGMLSPSLVFNVSSLVAWDMYAQYGRQLHTATNLYAAIFCFDSRKDEMPKGNLAGYLSRTIHWVERIYADNVSIVEDLARMYGFSSRKQEKFTVLISPCMRTLGIGPLIEIKKANDVNRVLWIGQLSRQKRPDRLVQIAESLPMVKFVVYGSEGDSPVQEQIIKGRIRNIEFRGVYTSPEEIEPSEFQLYLNTSDWDGLPVTMLDAANSGLPIVASDVGGISELVNERTGWLIDPDDDVSDYLLAIRQILIGGKECRKRVQAAKELVNQRHGWKEFVGVLDESGAFETAIRSELAGGQATLERRVYKAVAG